MSEDVVIAGGGPNGLMLACELSLAGARPLVLEQLPEVTERNRANGMVGQVVRLLDHRGLYQRMTGNPQPPQPVPAFPFGALPMELHDLPDNPLYALPMPQRRVEEVLEQRAIELGVRIRRGHELTGLAQDPDGVDIDVTGPDGPYRSARTAATAAPAPWPASASPASPGTTPSPAARMSRCPPDWSTPPPVG
jgi:2-polyprenyl-6-methoxyphenol hydroxylase-like FAD-dependent oxidoreductase